MPTVGEDASAEPVGETERNPSFELFGRRYCAITQWGLLCEWNIFSIMFLVVSSILLKMQTVSLFEPSQKTQ